MSDIEQYIHKRVERDPEFAENYAIGYANFKNDVISSQASEKTGLTQEENIKPQRILFVDFFGVISYDPFWASLQSPDHPLHPFFDLIENLLFRGANKADGLVDEWMLGKYTSEQILQIIEDRTGAPYQAIWDVFCDDCKRLDISLSILQGIQTLRENWYCILRTDNMDSFDRFTIPANPYLAEAFDEVHNSYTLRQLKETDGGRYFLSTSSGLGVSMVHCALIDDSDSTCKLFENLGGKAYCTQTEAEVIAVLSKLGPSCPGQ